MDRETAYKVIEEHVESDSLKKHLLAVETCMRAYARRAGEDEETWGIAGMVHDFDWEVCPTPESHPTFGAEILRANGFPEEIVRAVLSHGNHTGIARETLMEKALFACDELSGFVTAVTLVRPTKSLSDTAVRSVKKKMKDKAFAKSINRDDIVQGAEELEVDLDEHIGFVIEALKPVAPQLGLNP
ncbi:MAG: HDIG domain-containing protein [SAR202 cluster bacterium]|nr:HDIG domain-containing protein [SAR202 cluster bacterium]